MLFAATSLNRPASESDQVTPEKNQMLSLISIAAAAAASCAAPIASSELAWLTGTWRTQRVDGYSEVTFGLQYEGRVSGVLRVVHESETILVEVVSLELASGGANLFVRHLGRDLGVREAHYRFHSRELCANRSVFENSSGPGASPHRSSYWIDEVGRLHVLIEGIVAEDGTTRNYESELERVP
ncbi:MAG TPA: DUF6265 family protein [Nitrospiraceae bacterium]|nr:DUF6265 family protein [Nitrospiraceae bacterium]